jgi:hypothetical protein
MGGGRGCRSKREGAREGGKKGREGEGEKEARKRMF